MLNGRATVFAIVAVAVAGAALLGPVSAGAGSSSPAGTAKKAKTKTINLSGKMQGNNPGTVSMKLKVKVKKKKGKKGKKKVTPKKVTKFKYDGLAAECVFTDFDRGPVPIDPRSGVLPTMKVRGNQKNFMGSAGSVDSLAGIVAVSGFVMNNGKKVSGSLNPGGVCFREDPAFPECSSRELPPSGPPYCTGTVHAVGPGEFTARK